ncbi:MAG: hypothetical protein AB7K36_05770 [Chloroflexota bacterium]
MTDPQDTGLQVPRLQDTGPDTAQRAEDLALLRRFEPVLRFTAGEDYTPQAIDTYLARCSLWVHLPDGRDEVLVERWKLTPELLVEPRHLPPGAVMYLDFTDPLDLPNLTALYLHEGVERLRGQVGFHPRIGRLARVGYVSRLLAALFSLTLLLRGRVPGDAAAAALLATRQLRVGHPEHVYYGRVVRDPSGWTILQYWYFYTFDNWRSGFYGANDHEADWEMASVYLYEEPDGDVIPAWAAYSCHDFAGGDLRRRWDDRGELELVDEHPVLYVGVGSHAGYFRPGDYLAEIDIPLLAPLARAIQIVRQIWVGTLHQAGVAARVSRLSLFRIPFVDYARGDGVSIGPGQPDGWSPVLLDPLPAWASDFRGLWGFYARDPLSGEDSPAGPLFDRDGSPRRAWDDPLGWVGLDGIPTPDAEPAMLERRRIELHGRQRQIEAELDRELTSLERVHTDLAALGDQPLLPAAHRQLSERLAALRRRTSALREERGECLLLMDAIQARQSRLARGLKDPPRDHITNLASPVPEPSYRWQRLAELWSAVSIAALVAGVLALTYTDRGFLAPHLLLLVIGFLVVDATLRRQLRSLVTGLAVTLAVVTGAILVYEWSWHILLGGIVAAVLYLAWSNVREIFR